MKNTSIEKERKSHGTEFFPVAVYEEHQTPEIMIVDYHYHEEWEFLWLLDGKGRFQIDDHSEILQKGGLMCVPPCAIHGGIPLKDQDCAFRAVVFHPRLLGGAATDLLQSKYIEPFLKRHSRFPYFLPNSEGITGEIIHILEKVFAICRTEHFFGFELMVKGLLLTAWSKLLASGLYEERRQQRQERRNQKLLMSVLEYVHAHQHELITTKDLAQMLDVSESYFCRFFRKSMQMTATEYIQRCRIKAASAMLSQPRPQPIIDIAFACGFNNLSYFNLVFKKLMGCTPTEYRLRSLT